jgi:hypothetical protein
MTMSCESEIEGRKAVEAGGYTATFERLDYLAGLIRVYPVGMDQVKTGSRYIWACPVQERWGEAHLKGVMGRPPIHAAKAIRSILKAAGFSVVVFDRYRLDGRYQQIRKTL